MTLPGARQRLKDNKEATVRNYEIEMCIRDSYNIEQINNVMARFIAMRILSYHARACLLYTSRCV